MIVLSKCNNVVSLRFLPNETKFQSILILIENWVGCNLWQCGCSNCMGYNLEFILHNFLPITNSKLNLQITTTPLPSLSFLHLESVRISVTYIQLCMQWPHNDVASNNAHTFERFLGWWFPPNLVMLSNLDTYSTGPNPSDFNPYWKHNVVIIYHILWVAIYDNVVHSNYTVTNLIFILHCSHLKTNSKPHLQSILSTTSLRWDHPPDPTHTHTRSLMLVGNNNLRPNQVWDCYLYSHVDNRRKLVQSIAICPLQVMAVKCTKIFISVTKSPKSAKNHVCNNPATTVLERCVPTIQPRYVLLSFDFHPILLKFQVMPIPLRKLESSLLDFGKQFGGTNLRPQRDCLFQHNPESRPPWISPLKNKLQIHILDSYFKIHVRYEITATHTGGEI